MATKPFQTWLILAGIVLLFCVLAVAQAATRAPWCDEAYFAEPALQILKIGRMATLVDPPSPIDDPRTVGTDRFLFWTLPLDIVQQAAWYRVVGFGMIQMRLLATLWALVAIASWWRILKAFEAGPLLRIVSLALITFDYSFLRSGSEGRMDMMSAALGFLGIALFLHFEARSYTRSVLLGTICTAASVLTHPIGGALATAGLGVTMLWYSRGRFRLWHPLLAAVPYLFFFACWGVYILQAPDIFKQQLLSISGNRLDAWTRPFNAIRVEFANRWAAVFGLTGAFGLKQLRVLVLFAYIAGLAAALVRFPKWLRSGFGLATAIVLLDIFLLCFGDSTKSAAYLIHVTPWLAVLLAVLLVDHWRPFGALVFAIVIAIQISGTAYLISRREYQREYMPAIEAIRNQGTRVIGSSELGFGLGFDTAKLIDDRRLGYYTHSKPPLTAMGGIYDDALRTYRTTHPEIAAYIDKKIGRSKVLFSNSLVRLYTDPEPE